MEIEIGFYVAKSYKFIVSFVKLIIRYRNTLTGNLKLQEFTQRAKIYETSKHSLCYLPSEINFYLNSLHFI